MINNIEKKLKIIKWRLRLLEQMKYFLTIYKKFEDEQDLEFAKELGQDSEKLKNILSSM